MTIRIFLLKKKLNHYLNEILKEMDKVNVVNVNNYNEAYILNGLIKIKTKNKIDIDEFKKKCSKLFNSLPVILSNEINNSFNSTLVEKCFKMALNNQIFYEKSIAKGIKCDQECYVDYFSTVPTIDNIIICINKYFNSIIWNILEKNRL